MKSIVLILYIIYLNKCVALCGVKINIKLAYVMVLIFKKLHLVFLL